MKQDKGMINFSQNGISLALDIPFSSKLTKIIPSLDKIINLNKGKIYLAKILY